MSHLANLLSTIQGGIIVRHQVVDVKRTKLNLEVLKLLQEQGFINGIFISNKKLNNVSVFLKYHNNEPVLKGLKIISIPSRRVFVSYDTILKHLMHSGLFVISTSLYGLICSDDFCKQDNKFVNVGGELLFQIVY
jgi:small subunit ribosomal protein S8